MITSEAGALQSAYDSLVNVSVVAGGSGKGEGRKLLTASVVVALSMGFLLAL